MNRPTRREAPPHERALMCPHGYKAIAIADRQGNGSRITSGKCCGRWQTRKRWGVSVRDMLEAAEQAQMIADAAAQETP